MPIKHCEMISENNCKIKAQFWNGKMEMWTCKQSETIYNHHIPLRNVSAENKKGNWDAVEMLLKKVSTHPQHLLK